MPAEALTAQAPKGRHPISRCFFFFFFFSPVGFKATIKNSRRGDRGICSQWTRCQAPAFCISALNQIKSKEETGCLAWLLRYFLPDGWPKTPLDLPAISTRYVFKGREAGLLSAPVRTRHCDFLHPDGTKLVKRNLKGICPLILLIFLWGYIPCMAPVLPLCAKLPPAPRVFTALHSNPSVSLYSGPLGARPHRTQG